MDFTGSKRRFSEVSEHGAATFWSDIRKMYSAAQSLEVPVHNGAAFHVRLDGRASSFGDLWFVSGVLQADWFEGSPEAMRQEPHSVVVKVSEAMYQAVVRHSPTLRILQASVLSGPNGPVIDTTTGRAVLAGAVALRQDATLEVAEIFCGGFNGWSQGVQILRSFGYSCSVKWLLDTDESCYEGTRQHHPSLHKVYNHFDLSDASADTAPAFICASLEHVWWAQGPAITGPSLLCASPPCQPWSTGGTGSGLEALDGQLMLHLFGQLSFLQVPVVLLEQVPGFKTHAHFSVVQQAWEDAGYSERWSQTIDLLEVAPVARKRLLLLLVRQDVQTPPLLAEWPVLPLRPTLGSFDCLPEHPFGLLQASQLPPEVLQVYLDPWYMPPSRHPQGRPQNPKGFRFRGLGDRAPTFLAQYHFQHELSPQVLERAGLYGALLAVKDTVRFFSGVEIALLHCATAATWLPKDDRVQMRILGNGLSPVHAVFPLTLAMQILGPPELKISTAQALLQCLSLRLRASNLRFLEFPSGWVICRDGEQLQSFLAVFDTWQPRQQLPAPASRFSCMILRAPTDTCVFVLAPDVPLGTALLALGQDIPEEGLSQLSPELVGEGGLPSLNNLPEEACLEVDAMPPLPLLLQQANRQTGQTLMCATGRSAYYFLNRESPYFIWALSQVMGLEGWQTSNFFEADRWFSAEGHLIVDRTDLHGAVTFRIIDVLAAQPFCLSLEQLQCFEVRSLVGPPRLRISGQTTLALCQSFPAPVFWAAGWAVHLLPGLSVEQGVQADLVFAPLRHKLRLPEWAVLYTCHKQLVVGLLRAIAATAANNEDDRIEVKVQLEGQTMWLGALPADLTFEDLADLWEQAGIAVRSARPTRVYSGPRPVDEALTLQQACLQPAPPGFISKGGYLLVTFVPETRGGGAKDEKFRATQSELAQLFLDKGLALNQTTAAVDRLLAQAGVSRVQRALELTEGANRWNQVKALCDQFTVSLPEKTSRAAKASAQLQHEATKRQNRPGARPKASDFMLSPGFFRNADGANATILSQLVPGASGVFLCDGQDASRLLTTWRDQSADELGLAILGHSCPDAASCQGHIGVPAQTSSGNAVLLHACWHNLGGSPLHVQCANDASVPLPEDVCVCLSVFKDEVRAADWENYVANPVRAVAEHMRNSGFRARLEAPFGRSFRLDGRPSQPAVCSLVQFHCRVPRAELLPLLRLSGHTQVYATPKTWQQEVLPGFAVVWAPGSKDEVVQLSLKVPEPLGLVRSKSRLGIRVAEAHFQAAWTVVRPDQDAPPKVEVTGLFKLSSAPPQLRSADIQAWAQQMHWQVRPLRCLGPGQWLLGANGPPPEGLLSMNQQAVLVQPVEPRQNHKPVIRAGRLPETVTVSTDVEAVDPLEANDPWKKYLNQQSRPIAAPPPAPRASAPPNQLRFDQQETRLQQLEAGLDEVRRGHRAVAHQLAHTQAAVEQQVDAVKGDLSSFAVEFRAQLQANAESQRVSQAAHQQQFQQGLDEIKALLAASARPRASAASKRPADKGDFQMELDNE